MSQSVKRIVKIFSASLVLFSSGGLAYWLATRGAQESSSQKDFQEALLRMRKSQTNPLQEIYKSKDFSKIEQTLLTSESGARTELLQAGVVFFDTHPASIWNSEDYIRLTETLMARLPQLSGQSGDRRSAVVLFHVLKRILPRFESVQISDKMEKSLKDISPEANPYEFAIYGDLASLTRPLPQSLVKKLQQCVKSKDTGLAMSCLSMGEQVHDTETQRKWLTFLNTNYESFGKPLKPFVARSFFALHKNAEKRARDFLKIASQSSEEVWEDVFLFGLIEMDLVKEYSTDLKRLSSSSKNPLIRTRAKSLIR